jgi:integrase
MTMASIEKRTRNGRTTFSVRYRDPSGSSRRKVFEREWQARAFLHESEHAKATGAWIDPADGKLLFGKLAAQWFNTKLFNKPSTQRMYRQLLDNQILPTLERTPISAIDTTMIEDLAAKLSSEGLSASRVRSAVNVVGQVLGRAVKARKLAHNPVKSIDREALPKRHREEMHFLTADQLETLADSIDPRYRVLVLVAGYSGLRAGELAALRVKHLNILRRTVRVAESATEVQGRLEWGPTKTYESRTVTLPRSVVEELAAHLAGQAHDLEALVFTAPEGGALRQTSLMQRFFHPAVTRGGLPAGLRFHDLRHTAASLAISTGANILAVSRMLGHADAAITLRVYGHLYKSDADALAAGLDSLRATVRVPVVSPGAPAVASSQVMSLRKAVDGG